MSHGRRVEQIGCLEGRVVAVQRELSELKSQLASYDTHAVQIARQDERLNVLERQLAELMTQLAEERKIRSRNLMTWLQVLVNGGFIIAGSVAGALVLDRLF